MACTESPVDIAERAFHTAGVRAPDRIVGPVDGRCPFRARTGHAGHDGPEVELDRVGEDRIGRRVRAEEALLAAIRLDQFHARFVAPAQRHVLERLGVHREESHGGAVFGRHVRDRCAVRERK